MKIEIDSNTLLEILKHGPTDPTAFTDPHNPYAEGYIDGRRQSTQHIATLIGIEAISQLDAPTFNEFLYFLKDRPETKIKDAA